jgi:hypothetical protein
MKNSVIISSYNIDRSASLETSESGWTGARIEVRRSKNDFSTSFFQYTTSESVKLQNTISPHFKEQNTYAVRDAKLIYLSNSLEDFKIG